MGPPPAMLRRGEPIVDPWGKLWSPADEWIMAQMSVLEAVRGQPAKSAEYAATARELSVLGGNIERALSRQLIFLPQKVGSPAQAGPIRRPADQLLNQLPAAPLHTTN